jgi:hypothetical protein
MPWMKNRGIDNFLSPFFGAIGIVVILAGKEGECGGFPVFPHPVRDHFSSINIIS